MRTGHDDFSPIAGQTAKPSGRHTEKQIRQTFIELGKTWCFISLLGLIYPGFKGFYVQFASEG